jgi:TatD DNase family protein
MTFVTTAATVVDSHCHLDFPDFNGRMPELRQAMQASGVTHALCISVNLADFPNVLRLAEEYENFYASVGIHPEQGPETAGVNTTVEELVRLAQHPKIVAIGETGLDYHWHKDAPEWQRERFRLHIRAAKACGKPLVVHTRDAAEDTLRIMAEEGASEVGGVMHCFTESLEVAQAAMRQNFYISFSGIVTFKNATMVHEAARGVPLERLLVETDSPYLAPVPYRGKTNQPAYVRQVAERVAELKGLDADLVMKATSDNFHTLFRV